MNRTFLFLLTLAIGTTYQLYSLVMVTCSICGGELTADEVAFNVATRRPETGFMCTACQFSVRASSLEKRTLHDEQEGIVAEREPIQAPVIPGFDFVTAPGEIPAWYQTLQEQEIQQRAAHEAEVRRLIQEAVPYRHRKVRPASRRRTIVIPRKLKTRTSTALLAKSPFHAAFEHYKAESQKIAQKYQALLRCHVNEISGLPLQEEAAGAEYEGEQ